MTRSVATAIGAISELARWLLTGCAVLVSASPSASTVHTAIVQGAKPIAGFPESLELISDLLDRGRGIEAENIARALLLRVESVKGPDALEVAEVLDLLGRAVRRSPRVKNEEKRAIAERAVAIKEARLGSVHPDLATSLLNLGVQRTLEGDLTAARPLLERALAIREAAFAPGHLSVAGVQQSLAGLLIMLEDNDGAKVLLERAQLTREAHYGLVHPTTIRTLVNLAILYQGTGDYAGARERLQRARVRAEAIDGPADPLTLHVLTGVAVVLSELGGDFAGSAGLNEKLLALTEQSFGPADPRLRVPLDNLAMDRRDLGDYAAARALAERSLAIAERTRGPKHAEVATSLHTLATVVAGLGDYAEAMRLFERATRINEEVLQPSDPERARASWFIRDLLPLSGYGTDDMDLFERVLAVRERSRGLGDPRTAEGLSNLAAVLSSRDDYRRMRPLFERALEAQEKLLGPDHPEVGSAATNLADVLSRAGESDMARPLYERALAIWEKSLGADHPKVATGLGNLARFHMRTGNYDAPAPLLTRALAIQEKGLGPAHPDIALTLSSRAHLAAHGGAAIEAFVTAARAEAINREHLRLAVRTLPERQALAYASSFPLNLDLMLRLAAAQSGDTEMSTAAWDAVIRARAMVFDGVAARHGSATASESAKAVALMTALGTARQRLAALAVRGVRTDPPEHYRRLLDEARAEKDNAERSLAEHSMIFRDDQTRTRALLPDVSAALPDGSALVAFVRYQGHRVDGDSPDGTPRPDPEPSYLAFVLRAGDGRPALVSLGSASHIDALVAQWRRQLDQEAIAAGRGANRGEAAYRRVAGALRQQVWDPLVTHLANATHVFIVPDGALHLVNFAALPTGASQYLVEAGPMIHYLSAERDLVRAEAGPPGGRGLLALGGPAFDASGVAPVASALPFRGTRSACGDFQSMRFESLPAALAEVDDVVRLWTDAHGRSGAAHLSSAMPSSVSTLRLTGAEASEAAFKSAAAGRRVLHVATHGFFLGGRCASTLDPSAPFTPAGPSARIVRENPLLLSGLILAGANHRNLAAADQEDGVLTGEEVAAMNLDGVEWAVLSGCDTGVGEVRAGEGVFGLRRAFQIAGARTVIISLWQVEDEATRQWMTTLYAGRFMKRLSTMDAIREASLTVLRSRRDKGLGGHPFYWAPFVAAGDWR